MNVISAIDKKLSKVFRKITVVAGIIAFFMMCIAVLNVITRAVFKQPIYGVVEIMSYASLAVGALACAQNELDDGNAVMTLVIDSIAEKKRHLVLFIANILCAVFFGSIAVRFIQEVPKSYTSGQTTVTIALPMYLVYIVLAFGFVCVTLASLMKTFRHLAAMIRPKDEAAASVELPTGCAEILSADPTETENREEG